MGLIPWSFCKPSLIPFFLVLLSSMKENQSLSLGAISRKPSWSWMANRNKSVFPVNSCRRDKNIAGGIKTLGTEKELSYINVPEIGS